MPQTRACVLLNSFKKEFFLLDVAVRVRLVTSRSHIKWKPDTDTNATMHTVGFEPTKLLATDSKSAPFDQTRACVLRFSITSGGIEPPSFAYETNVLPLDQPVFKESL